MSQIFRMTVSASLNESDRSKVRLELRGGGGGGVSNIHNEFVSCCINQTALGGY